MTLTVEGIGERVVAPGAADRAACDAVVEQRRAPALREARVVVLDNPSVHKSDDAREAVAAAGCRLVFLPTCSPDLSPIGQAFAKRKARVRRTEPRDIGAVVAAVGSALAEVTAEDAVGFFRAAGYLA